MLDRAQRNTLSIAKAEPALRPVEVIFAWAEDLRIAYDPAALIDLAERLRDARLLFSEDGALVGSRLVDALYEQAELVKDESRPARNRLRLLAQHTRKTLEEFGLL